MTNYDPNRSANRRRLLKLIGGTALGVGLFPGTVSAHKFTFDGCEAVCTDTQGNFAVVDTSDGYEGRQMSPASGRDKPWSHDHTFCYDAADCENVVAFIEEKVDGGNRAADGCTLHVNPNDCVGVDAQEIKANLDGKTIGVCNGAIEPACDPSLPPADWVEFARTYGEGKSASAEALVQTADGGFALAGWQESATNERDILLVKTDDDGNPTFERAYGGDQNEQAFDIVETSDGGFALAGFTTSFGVGDFDAWLVKTDEAGNVAFTQTYGDEGRDRAKALVQTVDGGFALGGDTTTGTTGSSDFWLVKTDEAGNEEFSQTYGGSLSETANAMVQTSDGGFALTGTTLSFGSGGNDVWLVKTDGDGNQEFAEPFGGGGLEIANSLVQTPDDGFALAGVTTSFDKGGGDIWLVKTDEEGNKIFAETYGSMEQELADAIVRTHEDGFALAGFTESSGVECSDFFLITINEKGETTGEWTYGTCGDDRARALVRTCDCGFAFAGDVTEPGGSSEMALVKTVSKF